MQPPKKLALVFYYGVFAQDMHRLHERAVLSYLWYTLP